MFTQIIERISRKLPVTIMAHAILNNVLSDEKLNGIFKNHRQSQRESRWLFSIIVGLMRLVVTILCEDAYAQERSLFPRLLELAKPNQLWFADRNFCCSN